MAEIILMIITFFSLLLFSLITITITVVITVITMMITQHHKS